MESEDDSAPTGRALVPSTVTYRSSSLITRVPSWIWSAPALLVVLISLLATGHPWLALSTLAFAFVLGILLAQESRFVAGADGVALEWLWRRRFFPRHEIVGVSAYEKGSGSGLVLELKNGTDVEVPLDVRSSAAAYQSVQQVLGFEGAGVAAASATALARGGLSAQAWFSRLRTIGATDGVHYRVAALPSEELWAVVENPTATASERAAAAIALRSASPVSPGEIKDRLVRVATETVDETLRAFLERAAADDGSEEDLESAFIELENVMSERR